MVAPTGQDPAVRSRRDGCNGWVFEIDGTEEGFTLWRHSDDVTDEDECLETDDDGFCLMLSEGP